MNKLHEFLRKPLSTIFCWVDLDKALKALGDFIDADTVIQWLILLGILCFIGGIIGGILSSFNVN